jgi:hypothetical protein
LVISNYPITLDNSETEFTVQDDRFGKYSFAVPLIGQFINRQMEHKTVNDDEQAPHEDTSVRLPKNFAATVKALLQTPPPPAGDQRNRRGR